MAAATALAAAAPTAEARAEAPPEAILDDLDRARRLSPPPGSLADPEVVVPPTEAPRLEREVLTIVAHGRWTVVPDFLLELIFAEHPSGVADPSFALALETGTLDTSMWAFEVNWTPYRPSAGNWLERGLPGQAATYAEGALHVISLDASYRKQIRFTQAFRAMVGGGLGVGVVAGDIDTAEVLPTCERPVADCAHWPRAADGKLDLPTRVVPVLHVLLGLEVDLPGGLSLRAQGGFRNAFYAGLALGLTP